MANLRKQGIDSGKSKREEICALSFPGQFSISEEWAEGLDGWFRELHQFPISEMLGKIAELLKKRVKIKIKKLAI